MGETQVLHLPLFIASENGRRRLSYNTEEKGMTWIETATWHNDTDSKYLSLMKMLLSAMN